MEVKLAKYQLDRIPLSLVIDDSTALVNLNYFFLRDRIHHTGQWQRWEDVPVVIPEFFTREFGEWCAQAGVKGKFSVVPVPAAIGRIDQGLPPFNDNQMASWLSMCRQVYTPNFDITPEMLTHTFVVDPETLAPLPSRIWEQYEWQTLPDLETVVPYIKLACEILDNVGLTPQGVTSPGGFGGHSLGLYAEAVGIALQEVTGSKHPYFFKRLTLDTDQVDTPVWYPNPSAGSAVGEVIPCTDDYTGSWTGYGEINPDYYISEDLEEGRLVEVIKAGSPAVLCSHWQGFYGMHNQDRSGFQALKTVVSRLREKDPYGEITAWRKASEITDYACLHELVQISGSAGRIEMDLPFLMPEVTLEITGADVRHVTVDGTPLRGVSNRRDFTDNTFYNEEQKTLAAFTPQQRHIVLAIG